MLIFTEFHTFQKYFFLKIFFRKPSNTIIEDELKPLDRVVFQMNMLTGRVCSETFIARLFFMACPACEVVHMGGKESPPPSCIKEIKNKNIAV